MPEENKSTTQEGVAWRDKPATDKQRKAIAFIAAMGDDSLKKQAQEITTVGQANQWLSRHWKDAMLEGPRPQFIKVYVPRAFIHAIQETDREGHGFRKLLATIPKGVSLADGTSLSGAKLTQSLSDQYRRQLAQKLGSITLYLPADRPTSLWMPGPDGTGHTMSVSPRALMAAMARHRDDMKHSREAQQQDRRQQQAQQKREEQQQEDQKEQEEERKPDRSLTHEEQEDEDLTEHRIVTTAAGLGISAAMIQMSGTAVPRHTAFRLAAKRGGWTQWHPIRRGSRAEEIERSLTYMAGKAGITIRPARPKTRPPAPAQDGLSKDIAARAQDAGNGKLHISRGGFRTIAEQNASRISRQQQEEPPRPFRREPTQEGPTR